jgi:hypothetical protein
METYNPEDLFKAIKSNDFDKVKSLANNFNEVIDINQKDENGNNALLISLWEKYFDITKFLVEKFKNSIDINQNGSEGKSALLLEISEMDDDINDEQCMVKFLVNNFKESIDINQKDESGYNALMHALGDYDLVKFLVNNFKESIDINLTNKDGNNALMLAYQCDENSEVEPQFTIVKFLIETFKASIDVNSSKNFKYLKNFEIVSRDDIKSYIPGISNYSVFKYKIDRKFSLISMVQHFYKHDFITASLHNWDTTYVNVLIFSDVLHKFFIYDDGSVKQISPTSFDKALEKRDIFLEAIEDLYSN